MLYKPLLFTVMILSIGVLNAQDMPSPEKPFIPQTKMNQRALGDKALSITAGLYIPLGTVLLYDWPEHEAGAYPSNLHAGGIGSLTYSIYLSPHWKIGLQLGGSFSQDINSNFVYTIPITFKGSYEFHPWGQVTIPVFLSTGMAISTWKEDNRNIDLILRPGFGVYFDWSYEWSFGIDISYLFIPQIGLDKEYERSIGNFMDVTLSAEYHF